MVQKLVVYPDERVNISCTDVRNFGKTLDDVLEDMIDTANEHGLDALAAIQIAYPYNIIIIRNDNGSFDEYINPRILTNQGTFESTETTLYYPDIEVKLTRYDNIKLIYEDRRGNPQHTDISDRKLSSTMQRKLDYLFGGTFLDKIDQNRRDKIIDSLNSKGLKPYTDDVCPTFSRKDYFVSFTDKILFFMGLSLLTPLFSFAPQTVANIYAFDRYGFIAVIVLMIGFFFYAQYEAKKYRQCSSCQIGNNIGVIVKRVAVGIAFATASYFIVNPA